MPKWVWYAAFFVAGMATDHYGGITAVLHNIGHFLGGL